MHSKIEYPFISLLLSGGHTLIAKQKISMMLKYLEEL